MLSTWKRYALSSKAVPFHAKFAVNFYHERVLTFIKYFLFIFLEEKEEGEKKEEGGKKGRRG